MSRIPGRVSPVPRPSRPPLGRRQLFCLLLVFGRYPPARQRGPGKLFYRRYLVGRDRLLAAVVLSARGRLAQLDQPL